MLKMNLPSTLALGLLFILAAQMDGQVPTEVPPPVSGAKPVNVERIKVHGKALEGNLERNAVDRDVFVFLPPSYATERARRYPVTCTPYMDIPLALSNGRTKFMSLRRSKAHSHRAPKR